MTPVPVQPPPPTSDASGSGGDRLDLDRVHAAGDALCPGDLHTALGERLEARVLGIAGLGADGDIDVAVGAEDGESDAGLGARQGAARSEEHTSELQSLAYLVCRLLLEKKKKKKNT